MQLLRLASDRPRSGVVPCTGILRRAELLEANARAEALFWLLTPCFWLPIYSFTCCSVTEMRMRWFTAVAGYLALPTQ